MIPVDKFTRSIAIIAFVLLALQLPASGKKVGDFYCRSNKTTNPINKANISSTASGFELIVDDMVFEIDRKLEIKKYGTQQERTAWQEIDPRNKPYFSIKRDGTFTMNFFLPGCGRDTGMTGKVKFIGNVKAKLFTSK
jgi:hypothetical protein